MTRDADRLKRAREQSLEERQETTTDRSPSIKSAASDSTRYLSALDRISRKKDCAMVLGSSIALRFAS
jgi:hypothetical protein